MNAASTDSTMTTNEAAEVVRAHFPDFNEIRGLSLDNDGYWTATVIDADDCRFGVSFPDWYPDAFAAVHEGRIVR